MTKNVEFTEKLRSLQGLDLQNKDLRYVKFYLIEKKLSILQLMILQKIYLKSLKKRYH